MYSDVLARQRKLLSRNGEHYFCALRANQKNAYILPLHSFVAENWKQGWMGQFMWGVFSNYMNLKSSDIVAMTTLNFTSATNPKNATSVYKGSSSFTRCVWEVHLGNAVSFLRLDCQLCAFCCREWQIEPDVFPRRICASATSGRPRSAEA